jgi:hypothetical protein
MGLLYIYLCRYRDLLLFDHLQSKRCCSPLRHVSCFVFFIHYVDTEENIYRACSSLGQAVHIEWLFIILRSACRQILGYLQHVVARFQIIIRMCVHSAKLLPILQHNNSWDTSKSEITSSLMHLMMYRISGGEKGE